METKLPVVGADASEERAEPKVRQATPAKLSTVEIVSDPAIVARFERFVAPGHRITHLILVSSQFGVPRVNVYGFLDSAADPPMP